ncbi:MAG TPA: WYL domain-containing protein [Acidimicrobiales bacterium]
MAQSDKLERLMNLTAALLDAERALTSEDIQERVTGYAEGKEAFRRTFERDKDELRQLGIPITMVTIPGSYPEEHGYRIERDAYELPDPGLAPDELAALRLALQAVRVGEQSGDGSEGLWKLGGLVETAEDSAGGADDAVASLPPDPSLVPLFSAVLERRVARFRYVSSSGEADREVEPWRLEYRRGRWYLTAYDHERREERNFRLDRITGAVELDEPGTAAGPAPSGPAQPDQPWAFGAGEAVTAVLRVDADHARLALDQLGQESVMAIDDDGATTFAVPVTSWPAFRSFALSFLDHAEVLEPADLRADLVDWLHRIAGASAR